MARLFVAALPDAATVAALRSLSRPDETGVRWVPEENWHITLRFIGDESVDAVTELLRKTELPATAVRLGPNVERLGSRQLVIPAQGLEVLAGAVHAATGAVGQVDRRSFFGHLTVARTKPDAPSAMINCPFTSEFTITEVALVASELRPTGAEYSTIETFPLTRAD